MRVYKAGTSFLSAVLRGPGISAGALAREIDGLVARGSIENARDAVEERHRVTTIRDALGATQDTPARSA
ncbi:MAG TPA: hypothetical protein VFS18_04340 [Actinomycetota bacterium]|nr:hypothetical protein [Actinomycetota bacterium]